MGGLRRPDSRPSRRRCRLASSRVEPLIDLTSPAASSVAVRGVRTCTTVFGGSSEDGRSVSPPDPLRRLRLRRRAGVSAPPSASSSPPWLPASAESRPAPTASPAPSSSSKAAPSGPSSAPPRPLAWPRPPRRLRRPAGPPPSASPSGPLPAPPSAVSSSARPAPLPGPPVAELPRPALVLRRAGSPESPVASSCASRPPRAGAPRAGASLLVRSGGWKMTTGGWNIAAGAVWAEPANSGAGTAVDRPAGAETGGTAGVPAASGATDGEDADGPAGWPAPGWPAPGWPAPDWPAPDWPAPDWPADCASAACSAAGRRRRACAWSTRSPSARLAARSRLAVRAGWLFGAAGLCLPPRAAC